jgi:hypothetical protein
MDNDKVEQDGEDEGGRVAVCYALSWDGFGCPGGTEDAVFDSRVDLGGVWFCVGDEKLSV